MHTDITQVRLASDQWVYIPAKTDEASKEVLSFKKQQLINNTLTKLIQKLPDRYFLKSMLRRENCYDNALIESFFTLQNRIA